MSAARTPAGRLTILALRRAIRFEKRATLAEERGEDATDLWAFAREARHEAGQDPSIIRSAPEHIRATVGTWRKDFEREKEPRHG